MVKSISVSLPTIHILKKKTSFQVISSNYKIIISWIIWNTAVIKHLRSSGKEKNHSSALKSKGYFIHMDFEDNVSTGMPNKFTLVCKLVALKDILLTNVTKYDVQALISCPDTGRIR